MMSCARATARIPSLDMGRLNRRAPLIESQRVLRHPDRQRRPLSSSVFRSAGDVAGLEMIDGRENAGIRQILQAQQPSQVMSRGLWALSRRLLSGCRG